MNPLGPASSISLYCRQEPFSARMIPHGGFAPLTVTTVIYFPFFPVSRIHVQLKYSPADPPEAQGSCVSVLASAT